MRSGVWHKPLPIEVSCDCGGVIIVRLLPMPSGDLWVQWEHGEHRRGLSRGAFIGVVRDTLKADADRWLAEVHDDEGRKVVGNYG